MSVINLTTRKQKRKTQNNIILIETPEHKKDTFYQGHRPCKALPTQGGVQYAEIMNKYYYDILSLSHTSTLLHISGCLQVIIRYGVKYIEPRSTVYKKYCIIQKYPSVFRTQTNNFHTDHDEVQVFSMLDADQDEVQERQRIII